MKLSLVAATLFLAATAQAAPAVGDTIRVADFGVRPGTYRNMTPQLQAAIDSCRAHPGAVLLFEPGRYDLWQEGAVRKEIYISNTSSETEAPDKTKVIPLHFYNLDGLTVVGNGATLMMHGLMTPIAIDSCLNVTLSDLTIDYERPAASELTYTEVAPGRVVVRVHPDTRYDISPAGRLRLIGEGWASERIHCIKLHNNGHFRYSNDWGVLASAPVKEIEPHLLEFTVPEDFTPAVGETLTLRDIIRYQVGMLNLCSSGTTLRDVRVRFMHGLGIVSQYSRDITMERVDCRPDEHSGRKLASSADFMHFSGCSGHIEITQCNYAGAQDDAINVHGTNLRAVEQLGSKALRLRFMHHQTYGSLAYQPGDTVAFVNPHTMLRTDTAVVASVAMADRRNLDVTFDRPVPRSIEIGATCVENLTATPTLHVAGCTFTRQSTRGILASTPRSVVIEHNRFDRLGMAAILIEGDAEGWYESGPVTNVVIRDNEFIDCGYAGATHGATIALNPSNTVIDPRYPVHENVRITGNRFITSGRPVLFAKSTGNLLFMGNTVESASAPKFLLNGCRDVTITGNRMPAPQVEERDCLSVPVEESAAR